mmetsp:Transcript_87207/g.202992  ORF Transcript_87207/g.202992 Transcript_87207/m.202992 type:complete len:481 (-) Transcript_87207:62-1504(-)
MQAGGFSLRALTLSLLLAWALGDSVEEVSLLQTQLQTQEHQHQEPATEHFWPSGTGRIQSYTSSPFAASRDLKDSLSWTWHSSQNRYGVVPGGANIDKDKNIYLEALDGIRKFSPEGELLWEYLPPRDRGEEMPDMSSIYEGAVYVSTTHGRIIAISMETGKELWVTKLRSTDGNNGWVSVEGGVVITGSDAAEWNRFIRIPGRSADQFVTGLNATDGRVMWKFKPDAPVWNFMGSFVGDGTFTFQDYEGRAYRCSALDGSLIWKAGGVLGSWTDGSALLGPNRVVYTVSNRDYFGGTDAHGYVSAFRLEDGKPLWRATVPRPPNNMPAIGRLTGRTGLSLVQPIGQQCVQGSPTDVYALDAETGKLQWVFNGPAQKDRLQAGDSNVLAQQQRTQAGVRSITAPNPWSAPTIDAEGTVFIGSEEGPFFALADLDGDGVVQGDQEVSRLETGACFSGSSAAAIAPGMMVATSIDAMYVFKF